MQLDGKVAIVTGGASGIGAAISRVFTSRGAKVVAVDIAEEAGAALAAELGEAFTFMAGDISDPQVPVDAVALAVSKYGHLDTVVNNAHASQQAMFVDLTDDQWELSMQTGLMATKRFMLAAHPELAKKGGSVINFGSGAGLEGQPTQAAYAAAKEAIRGLSRVVANEWAPEAIRVNVVCPIALTGGVAHWKEQFPEMYDAVVAKIPLGRFGDPEADVAPVVAFLASDDSRYMTGQTLLADGGSSKLR
jgi:NAD(P)-dependent dehydrogenase (short-subunit alcohol dehydrogenase family)